MAEEKNVEMDINDPRNLENAMNKIKELTEKYQNYQEKKNDNRGE